GLAAARTAGESGDLSLDAGGVARLHLRPGTRHRPAGIREEADGVGKLLARLPLLEGAKKGVLLEGVAISARGRHYNARCGFAARPRLRLRDRARRSSNFRWRLGREFEFELLEQDLSFFLRLRVAGELQGAAIGRG